MPKRPTKFNAALRLEFPFLKVVANSEKDVFCTLCSCKFSVSDGGRSQINTHIKSAKHVKNAKTVSSNQTLSKFVVGDSKALQQQQVRAKLQEWTEKGTSSENR